MSAAKNLINIVVIGQVDPGKSTNAGGLITRAQGAHTTFADMEPERGKGNFKYAWVLEMMEAQRDRGITIDISMGGFETSNFNVNIVNVPGPADLGKSTNTGISQADAAILVIGAGTGQIEENLKDVQLAFSNGLQLIVGIENMESTEPAYSEEQLEKVKREVSSSIKDIGYNPAAVAFVPFSSSQGDNLTKPTTQMPWFKGWSVERAEGHARGTSLIEAIDALLPPTSTTRLS